MQYCDSIENCSSGNSILLASAAAAAKGYSASGGISFLAEQPAVVGPDGELARIRIAVTDALLPILDSRFKKLEAAPARGRIPRPQKPPKTCRSCSPKAQSDSAAPGRDRRRIPIATGKARATTGTKEQKPPRIAPRAAAKLETASSSVVGRIRNPAGVHGRGEPPGAAASAPDLAQLNMSSSRRVQSRSQVPQKSRAKSCASNCRRVTVELIDKRSWSSQARRILSMVSARRSSLAGLHRRKSAKGHGIALPFAPRAARKNERVRGAVPVWVMPLFAGGRKLRPAHQRASRCHHRRKAHQSDVMALVACTSQTVLVVGDHREVSPPRRRQDLGVIQISSSVPPGNSELHLYDGQISIYDLASQSFAGQPASSNIFPVRFRKSSN